MTARTGIRIGKFLPINFNRLLIANYFLRTDFDSIIINLQGINNILSLRRFSPFCRYLFIAPSSVHVFGGGLLLKAEGVRHSYITTRNDHRP